MRAGIRQFLEHNGNIHIVAEADDGETAKGYTNKAIGAQLAISGRTVQGHLAHIFTKLNASSRTEAVMRGVSLGLV